MSVDASGKTKLIPIAVEQQQREEKKKVSAPVMTRKVHYPFWFGGSASCFAASVTHPLDLGNFPLTPDYIRIYYLEAC